MKKSSEWWHEFFADFQPVFGMISQKNTNAQVRFVIDRLDLRPGRKFLDCPCGNGRIALPLAKKGVRVTGVDVTQPYLDEAAAKARRRGLKVDLIRSDMRRINFTDEFDAGGNLWTSFGFFDRESDNLLAIKKMFRAIKPGGKFLLHLINRDWIMANYEQTDWFEIGDLKVLQRREFDSATSTESSVWHFIRNGKETSHQVSIRMYSYHELIAMFKAAGFVDIEGCSSVKGDPITRDCRMMFIIGVKPRRR
jgi:cyclopropane fatty-acyl-phospholipid synthase-like methyltransferase